MNEVFDKLAIRVLFTIFICLILLIYKYAHIIFYPTQKKQVLKKIYPLENWVDALLVFSRLIGIAIILSTLELNEYIGVFIGSFNFLVWGLIGITIYLLSVWIMNSIIFYNFEYKSEVLKKQNPAYGIVSFITSISLGYLVKELFVQSEYSIIILIILWLFTMVIYGFSAKLYKYVSQLSFSSLMIQGNLSLAFSYCGFIMGNTVIMMSAFRHEHHEITSYLTQVVLKILLSALILPLFRIGISKIYKIQVYSENITIQNKQNIGYGIFEGTSYLTSCILTSIITGQIHFGNIYPFF